MTDPDGREEDDTQRLPPATAFGLLGDSARLEIVIALHHADRDESLSFSALYDAVSVDGTGKFNYHLDELVDHFVRKTDDGYELMAAGRRVARAVEAGMYTAAPTLDPVAIDGRCYACGAGDLEAAYEDERFRVRCRACDELVLGIRAPPSLVRNRDPLEVVEAVEHWSRRQVEHAIAGLCPTCGGALEPSVTDQVRDTLEVDVLAVYDCGVCGRKVLTSIAAVAARDPTVQRFHRERDAAYRDRHYWEIDQFVTNRPVTTVSRDPPRYAVTFESAGDECEATVSGALDVLDVTIRAGTPDE